MSATFQRINHLWCFRNARLLQDVVSGMLLAQSFSIGVSLCFQLYQVVTARGSLGDVLKYAAYMSVMVTELGVYCWFGNELITESETVAESACYCAHGARPVALRRGLLLVAVRAGRPLSISAGPLYVFCREAFVSVSSNDTL
ncbi:odorant receptor Or2-like [Schistocerca serialis cubense]|uniref:odorant receptor Or2-like n=1 Tax=Schistocerca serialis cubense TaxID=2023355 RepID=UPI00214F3235|nr:odorant receptor Or2-like [Schistocerca serialis cubense]